MLGVVILKELFGMLLYKHNFKIYFIIIIINDSPDQHWFIAWTSVNLSLYGYILNKLQKKK